MLKNGITDIVYEGTYDLTIVPGFSVPELCINKIIKL